MDSAEKWSRTCSKAAYQVVFERCGVPCSPYRTVAEAMNDPQIAHRQSIEEVRDLGGSFKVLNPPFRLSDAESRAGAPLCGPGRTHVNGTSRGRPNRI